MSSKKTKSTRDTEVKQLNKKRRVKFSFSGNNAKEVFLVGSFNDWDPQAHPMKRDKYGVWTKTLMILPGKYEYKFLADGIWVVDPMNTEMITNCFGTFNNALDLLPS